MREKIDFLLIFYLNNYVPTSSSVNRIQSLYLKVFFSLISHLLLIGFLVAFKPFSVMPLNPIKTTLNISAQENGGGCR